MKRKWHLILLGVLVLIWVFPGTVAGQEDQYLRIYTSIQEADVLKNSDRPREALTKYQDAQAALLRLQRAHPDWNSRIVNYRLTYLASRIGEISAQAPVPVVETTVTNQPVVEAVRPPANANAELNNQLNAMRQQLDQLFSEKAALEAKLKEALAAQPAVMDPRELAKAEERIRTLEKENELLKVSLNQQSQRTESTVEARAPETANPASAESARRLADENETLKRELAALRSNAAPPAVADGSSPQAGAQLAALQSERDILRLEKAVLENRVQHLVNAAGAANGAAESARIRQLERERDELQRRVSDSAPRGWFGRGNRAAADRVSALNRELEALRARLNVLEAQRVPYTTEELALFRRPQMVPAEGAVSGSSVRELPAETMSLVAEARRDFAARRLDQAEAKYRQVLQKADRNVGVLANLAVIQLEMGRLEEAEKNVRDAIAADPENAFSHSILGNLKFRQGQYDEALDALSQAARLDPMDADIQNHLGLALSQKGMRVAAETALRKAIQLQPGNGSAHHNLAVVYVTQKPPSLELARFHYQKGLSAGAPANPELEKLIEEAARSPRE